MPPSTSRPKRKRNLEPEGDNDKSSANQKQKRPNRRRIGDDHEHGNANGRSPHHEVLAGVGISSGRDGLANVAAAVGTSTRTALPQPRSNGQPDTGGRPTHSTTTGIRNGPSVLQQMRRLAQDAQDKNDLQSQNWGQKDESGMGNIDACDRSLLCESASNSTAESEDDANLLNIASALDRERRRSKSLAFFSAASFIYGIIILFIFSSVMYMQHFNHNLAILQKDAISAENALEQGERIKHEIEMHEDTLHALQTVHLHLEESRETVAQLNRDLSHATKTHRMEMQKHTELFQQQGKELSDAIERIELLREEREESNSAMNMAWLRIDELMEENNLLSNDLHKTRKIADEVERVQLRDKELVQKVESLTHQLKMAHYEKSGLQNANDHLISDLNNMAMQHDLLQQNHLEISDMFLGPILVYIQNLIHTTKQQHSIILDLTSMVHSLHSSLEISRADLETQTVESMHAVETIAKSMNELTTQTYEMERLHYMEHMEMQLQMLEDEAMGAVNAVAEAAGKMEFERKVEEEGRWRSYVAEAEGILGEIRENIEDGSTHGDFVESIMEKSVLRAAVSRRIEEGISSLRSYIRPYNYFKERDDVLIQSVETQPEETA